MNKGVKILIVLIILSIIGGLFWYQNKKTQEADQQTSGEIMPTPTPTVVQKESLIPYSNSTSSISFQYPSSFGVKEKQLGTASNPQLSIVLTKNIPGQQATTTAGEGPVTINVDVYQNKTHLNANGFVTKSANWKIEHGATSSVDVGSEKGIEYAWSGLYEGKSVVVTSKDHIYVFSVSWENSNDQIVRDFDMVLNSANFGNQ